MVKPGHLRGLAAEQRATGAAAGLGEARDDRREDARVEFPGTEVVEEEQRTRAHHRDVVHAVVHQILPDRVVASREGRDIQLRPHPVHAGHEHGILHAGESRAEETAESAHATENPGPVRAAHEGGQAVLERVAEVDIDSGLGVGGGFAAHGCAVKSPSSTPPKNPPRVARASSSSLRSPGSTASG